MTIKLKNEFKKQEIERKVKAYDELIEYLKEKIKNIDNLINKSKPKPYGEELHLYENSKLRYTEILSKLVEIDQIEKR